MEVGERIRQRREQLGMTQGELAKFVGYTSRSSVAKVEANANGMVQSKLIAFAKALKTTPSYLLGCDAIDEEQEKKNDAIADIILQLKKDKVFFELVHEISKLSPDERSALKSVTDALTNNK